MGGKDGRDTEMQMVEIPAAYPRFQPAASGPTPGTTSTSSYPYFPPPPQPPPTQPLLSHLEPTYNASNPNTYTYHLSASSFFRRHLSGHRFGLIRSLLLSSTTFATLLLLATTLQLRFPTRKGSAAIAAGSCTAMRVADVVIHLALNVLSTAILGAANYCMQGLCAPTRGEVDRAHGAGRWFDVGVQSVRNLRGVGAWKKVGWGGLGVASVPLHLVFNSAFFTTKPAFQYAVAAVSREFFDRPAWSPTVENSSPARFWANSSVEAKYARLDEQAVPELLRSVMAVHFNSDNFTMLDNAACISKYASGLLQERSNVVVVTRTVEGDVDGKSPVLWSRYPQRHLAGGKTNPNYYGWVCLDYAEKFNITEGGRGCKADLVLGDSSNGANWTLNGHQVQYCLSQTVKEVCKLQFNAWLLSAVVVFCAIQTFIMCILTWKAFKSNDHSLRTTGDAIASFLKQEDETTHGMCLVSERDLIKQGWRSAFVPIAYQGAPKQRWSASVGRQQWWLTHSTQILFILAIAIGLSFGLSGPNPTPLTHSFGRPDIRSLVAITKDGNGSGTLIPTVIIANLPQLAFSALYLATNALFTQMLIAHEWSQHSTRRSPLRVSEFPYGLQKSSRMLSLPGRYALGLMTYSTLVHWLISQSLFLVRFDGIDSKGNVDEEDAITRLGYSGQAIVVVLCMLFVGVGAGAAFGWFRSLSGGLPLGGSNSAIISAACHPPVGEKGAELGRLLWGEVVNDGQRKDGIRHCSLSAMPVMEPTVGAYYQ